VGGGDGFLALASKGLEDGTVCALVVNTIGGSLDSILAKAALGVGLEVHGGMLVLLVEKAMDTSQTAFAFGSSTMEKMVESSFVVGDGDIALEKTIDR
jgi:hypothetical protein